MFHPVYRIFEVKHQHRKVENQIKMAKMVLMNELNKQANGLIEELEVYVDRWIRWVGSVPFLGQKPGTYSTSPRAQSHLGWNLGVKFP